MNGGRRRMPRNIPLCVEQPATWLVLGGRGAGKTRLGAEWVNALVRGLPPFTVARRTARADRAGRRDAGRRARGDDRGAVRHPGDRPGQPAALRGDAPAPASGTMARWRRCSRRRTRRACAGRSFDAAWCDELAKWKNAEATVRHAAVRAAAGRAAAPAGDDDAAADAADEAADGRSGGDGDAAAHRRQRRQPGAGLPAALCRTLWRHAARPAGTRRRTDRGPRGRAVVARP